MITCPLCNEKYIFVSSLCEDCQKVRRLSALYGNQTIINILENILLRQKCGINKKTELESRKYTATLPTKSDTSPKLDNPQV